MFNPHPTSFLELQLSCGFGALDGAALWSCVASRREENEQPRNQVTIQHGDLRMQGFTLSLVLPALAGKSTLFCFNICIFRSLESSLRLDERIYAEMSAVFVQLGLASWDDFDEWATVVVGLRLIAFEIFFDLVFCGSTIFVLIWFCLNWATN